MAFVLCAMLFPMKSADAAGWIVVFQDDFNQASLDTSTWFTRFIYDNGTRDHLNDEQQRYREDGNHVLRNGILTLVAKPRNANGVYPSGMIRSRPTFRYGYFEARIKLPPGRGMFPSFWLNSDFDENGYLGWPPEIDIMEFAPNGITEFPNMVHSNLALSVPNTQGGGWIYRDSNFNAQWTFYRAPTDLTRDWHVYGMLWETDDTVTVYLDGKKLWQKTYRWLYKDGRRAGPAHILINLAVGGAWAGAGGIDNSKFPAYLQIDYVRVCQRVTNAVNQAACNPSAPKK
ncbi:glycoside hydrolase family 16 protein [Dongia sedimenti]|uniref:Glycoside hydrolase family 16 protein n=1 Tax=Dongia sedimenti TaxID=3064282 RepID=A0ABU0YR78_9PROT|nr:glycoside hydrolase family 16 protein [Rhodospirillaceae bacterium R-7]